MFEKELNSAIHDEDLLSVKTYLEKGANPNILIDETFTLNDALFYLGHDKENEDLLEILRLLIAFGANVNILESEESFRPIHYATKIVSLDAMKLLIDNGADPSIKLPYETGLPILQICNHAKRQGERKIHISALKLLLNNGARSTINKSSSSWCSPPLHVAVKYLNIEIVNTLLSNGADTSKQDIDGHQAIKYLPKINEKNMETWRKIHELIDPQRAPFIQINNENYIIYERKNNNPFLLGKIDSNYLYHGFDIALFIYWIYKRAGFIETVSGLLTKTINELDKLTSESLIQAVSSVSPEWNVDYFLEDKQKFAIGYLTITNWSYSLHYDLKKLYPTKESFVSIPEKQEDYNLIFKLFDVRYEQFMSKEYLNPNQTRESLFNLLNKPSNE